MTSGQKMAEKNAAVNKLSQVVKTPVPIAGVDTVYWPNVELEKWYVVARFDDNVIHPVSRYWIQRSDDGTWVVAYPKPANGKKREELTKKEEEAEFKRVMKLIESHPHMFFNDDVVKTEWLPLTKEPVESDFCLGEFPVCTYFLALLC